MLWYSSMVLCSEQMQSNETQTHTCTDCRSPRLLEAWNPQPSQLRFPARPLASLNGSLAAGAAAVLADQAAASAGAQCTGDAGLDCTQTRSVCDWVAVWRVRGGALQGAQEEVEGVTADTRGRCGYLRGG